MAETVGTIRAQMVLDVRKALENFTAVRLANLQTVTALRTGGGALVIAGAGMAAVGLGILGAFKGAADAAADFERQLDFFGAVSDSTEAEMEAVRLKALELGKDTIFSAGQIADSFVELGKAGVLADDIINGVGEAVANLGAAADIPLDTAANIILSAVQTFGLAAKDSVAVADLLAGAANASIVEVEDLGTSLKYAGGVANSLGIPLNDVVDALGLLGTYGIKGSQAGTSLRQVLVSLGGNSKKAKDELKALGIITKDGTNLFYDAQGSAKPLSEIFQLLQDKTKGYSDEQKVAAFRTIFQNRALATAISLTDSGAAGFAEMNAAISKTSALEVAGKRLNNLSGDVEILKGNLETMAIEVGGEVQNFLRNLVQGLTSVVQWFSDLSPQTQKVIIWLTAFLGVGLTVLGFLTAFAGSILILMSAWTQISAALKLGAALLKATAVAQWALNSALLANPITWIVVAVIALIAVFVLLWKNNEGFRNFFIGVWNAIKTAVAAVIDWFRGLPAWFAMVWDTISAKVSEVWNNIIAFFTSIPERIMSFFMNWTLPGLLIQHWDSIWATIQSVWNNILTFFQELPGKVLEFVKELPRMLGEIIGFAIGTVLRLLIEFGQKAWEVITTAFNNVVNFFKELPGKVKAIFNQVKDWATERIIAFSVAAITKVREIYNGIIDWFQKLPGRVRDLFVQVRDWAIAKITEFSIAAIAKARAIYNGVIDWFVKLPGRIRDAFIDAKDWAVQKFNEMKTRAVEIAKNIYTTIRDEIQKIPGKVKEIFLDAIQKVKDLIGTAKKAVTDFAGGLWDGFKDGLGIHSPSYIEEAMWQITDVVGTETDRMAKQVRTIQGLGNNITEVGNHMGEGFDATLTDSLNSVQLQMKQVMAYQQELEGIARTANLDNRIASVGSKTAKDVVTVQGGNQVTLQVEWHAAPDDTISTRQQVKELLGRTATILGGDLEDDDGK
jgi:TP901 family phage tail tape measure protein